MPKAIFDVAWNTLLNIDRWSFSRFEYMEPEETERIQRKKLGVLLKFSQENTKYWGSLIKTDPAKNPYLTLRSLPILDRETLKRNDLSVFEASHSPVWRKNRISTSGTSTNSPVVFYGDKLNFLRMESAMLHIFRLKNGDNLMRFNLEFPPYRPAGTLFSVNFAMQNSANIAKNTLNVLNKKKISHMLGPASSVLKLATLFRKYQIKFVLSGVGVVGESLIEADRTLIEEIFRCRVINIYASKEAGGPLAYECKKRSGWHMNTAHFFWEILDENNKEAAPGEEGDIVITMFENEVMPFIRYKIGDRGRILTEECFCGRKNPRLIFVGRDSQFIRLRDGYAIPFHSLTHFIRNSTPPIDQFQFLQKKPGEVTVKIVPLTEISSALISKVSSTANDHFRGRLHVNIEIADKIPGKSVLVIKN